jgi:glutaredoxin-like protein
VIPLKDQEALKQRFSRDLLSRVRIDFFSQKPSPIFIAGRAECVTCEDVRKLMREIAGLTDKVSLSTFDIETDKDWAQQLGVDRVPAIVLRGAANRAIRYFGTPVGTPFLAFIEMLVTSSKGGNPVKPETLKLLKKLRDPVDVKVFVQPSCPYSAATALVAANLALSSSKVELQIIEVNEFPQLAQRNMVAMTPLTVLNNEYALPGLLEETALATDIGAASEGKEPKAGGDPTKVTPVQRLDQPQAQQSGPRYSPGGLILPR